MARVTHGPKTRLIKHSCTLPFIVFIAQNLGLLHFTQPTKFEGEQGCCDSKHLDSPCYFNAKIRTRSTQELSLSFNFRIFARFSAVQSCVASTAKMTKKNSMLSISNS